MRRGAGHGSVDELPSGRFRVRITLADGSRRASTFETREEAEHVLNGALAELADANVAPVGAQTLLTWGPKWLDARETSGAHRAIATERSTWKNHVATAPFASYPLANITRREIKEWLASLTRKMSPLSRMDPVILTRMDPG